MSNNFNNYLFLTNKKLTAIPPKDNVVCKADTGASSNYGTEKDQHALHELKKNNVWTHSAPPGQFSDPSR